MLLAICLSACGWGEQVIRLGGVRNVTATVSEPDDTYRIAVEMLPVRAFDPATNKALNLSKGRMYAAQALAKHLKADSLTIRGLEVRESGTSGGSFRLVAVVPRDGVSAGAASTRMPRTAQEGRGIKPSASRGTRSPAARDPVWLPMPRPPTSSTGRSDYLDTIVAAAGGDVRGRGSLEGRSLKPDDFYDSIGRSRNGRKPRSRRSIRQVDDDKLLLSSEKKELRLALEGARAKVLEWLKAAVARFDNRQERTSKEET